MTFDFLGVAQLFSIIIGAMGTPGVTYFLMKRMSRDTIAHIKDSCAFCRSHLEEKINTIDHKVDDLLDRQIVLREKLPIDYVRREEFLRHVNGKK